LVGEIVEELGAEGLVAEVPAFGGDAADVLAVGAVELAVGVL